FLDVRVGQEAHAGRLGHGTPVTAAHDVQVGDKRQSNQVVCFTLDDSRIDEFDRVVREPVDDQPFARVPAGQCRHTHAAFARALGHPDQEDDLAAHDDRAGIEYADNLEVISERLEIGWTNQQALEFSF